MNEREEQELKNLKDNSPESLPLDPSSSGYTPEQIRKKFAQGLYILYGYLLTERHKIDDLLDTGLADVVNDLAKITAGNTVVGKALGDKDGNAIDTTYAKIINITNGIIGALKYVRSNNELRNISDIETDLANFISAYNTFKSAAFNGNKARTAEYAENVEKALRDNLGRIIKDTYATISSLDLTNTEITKIKNGSTIVQKAYKDQNGAVIDITYVKIANIINTLNDTSTNKPLSAAKGKDLQDQITAIRTLLASDDTSLDQLQEIVTYIKNNKSLIDGITLAKISYTDIIDNYTSNVANKPVSAKVAFLLKGLIDNIVSGTTKVAKAETADKVGNTTEEEIVKSVNGITPTNGNVGITGFVSFNVVEDGDYQKLIVNYQGDIGGTFSLRDIGDYKYVVFTPTGA